MAMGAIDLTEKLAQFSEQWRPKIVADFNGHDVMVVKPQGTPNTGDPATAVVKVRL
jgi:hypothetical protein